MLHAFLTCPRRSGSVGEDCATRRWTSQVLALRVRATAVWDPYAQVLAMASRRRGLSVLVYFCRRRVLGVGGEFEVSLAAKATRAWRSRAGGGETGGGGVGDVGVERMLS